jgi:tagatose-1,6-bisphosphate aldolase non-catalytic subunit AgaZ/GatZ
MGNNGFTNYGHVEGGQHMYVNGEEVEIPGGRLSGFDNHDPAAKTAAEVEAEVKAEAREALREVFGIES